MAELGEKVLHGSAGETPGREAKFLVRLQDLEHEGLHQRFRLGDRKGTDPAAFLDRPPLALPLQLGMDREEAAYVEHYVPHSEDRMAAASGDSRELPECRCRRVPDGE